MSTYIQKKLYKPADGVSVNMAHTEGVGDKLWKNQWQASGWRQISVSMAQQVLGCQLQMSGGKF